MSLSKRLKESISDQITDFINHPFVTQIWLNASAENAEQVFKAYIDDCNNAIEPFKRYIELAISRTEDNDVRETLEQIKNDLLAGWEQIMQQYIQVFGPIDVSPTPGPILWSPVSWSYKQNALLIATTGSTLDFLASLVPSFIAYGEAANFIQSHPDYVKNKYSDISLFAVSLDSIVEKLNALIDDLGADVTEQQEAGLRDIFRATIYYETSLLHSSFTGRGWRIP